MFSKTRLAIGFILAIILFTGVSIALYIAGVPSTLASVITLLLGILAGLVIVDYSRN